MLFAVCLSEGNNTQMPVCCYYDYDPSTRTMTPEQPPYGTIHRKWPDSVIYCHLGMAYDQTVIVEESTPEGEYWYHHYVYDGQTHIYNHSGEDFYDIEFEDVIGAIEEDKKRAEAERDEAVRIAEDMKAMAEAARAEGLSVVLSSGYRSYATQTYLFNRKVSQYGEAVAETIVARPGTSEHQTGLCCDITDRYYEMKDASLENTQMYKWMSEHCDEFGFIVRFPKGKEDVTGIIYEPWHFRYVGVEAATYIMEHDLTLEEFLALYRDEAGAE